MKLKDYVQSDDFLQKPLQQRSEWLSKQKGWDSMAPESQRQYLTGFGKGVLKPRDTISKVAGYALPLAGQLGAEAATGAAGVLGAPETGGGSLAAALAALSAAGGAGATAGQTAADYIDSKRGMAPKFSPKQEMKEAPRRMAYGAAGSAAGSILPNVVKIPKVAEGIGSTLESVATNPRAYTKALISGGTKAVEGSEKAIGSAMTKGEEAVGKFEADAMNKIKDIKSQMGQHWKTKGYGDPVKSEFEHPGPEPQPQQFKNIKQFQDAYNSWSKRANPPTPVKNNLQSIYTRYMKLVRERGKLEPKEEVPELVRVKRLAQDKINFDKYNTDGEQKLSNEDFRRIGKITNEADKRIAELDPKQKELEKKLADAHQDLSARQSSHSVKTLGGRGYPGRFQERLGSELTRTPKEVTGATKSAPTERTVGELKDIEKKTGINFLDDATNNMAKKYYSKALPQGRQPWMRRMAFGLPLSVAAGAIGGNKPSSYMMSMLPLMAMMSPAAMRVLLDQGMKMGPQALSQALRAGTEKDRE